MAPKEPTNESTSTHGNDSPSSSDSPSSLDSWKHRPPYETHRDASPFQAAWTGQCHCGRTRYQVSRRRPLASKYCHCTTCQRLHGAPFQWAAIFHKTDIRFTHGHHDLAWYDPAERTTRHKLPCKVGCAYCRAPIMDEGRNMVLLFPTLIEGINTPEGREAFGPPQAHIFYSRRVVEVRDGVDKWEGMQGDSARLDDDGRVVEGEEEVRRRRKKREEEEEKKKKKKREEEEEEEDDAGRGKEGHEDKRQKTGG